MRPTDPITLYTNPQSRGRIARWMLEETGVEYDTKVLDYGAHMATPPYRSINPMGKVPALVHGDRIITEAAAICAYLADAFPDADLAPPPNERAAYYRWLFFAAGPVESAVTMQAMKWDVPDASREMALGFGSVARVTDTLEFALTQTSYVSGESFSAADVYVGSQVIWGLGFKLLDPRPAFNAYAERLQAREAYQRATTLDDAAKPNWVA